MSEYITRKKVEVAKQMLASGATVSNTAQETGYASPQSFCKMFRRCTGYSPSEFAGLSQNAYSCNGCRD